MKIKIIIENEIEKKQRLVEFNSVIQTCKICGKIDVYKNDGHKCDISYQNYIKKSNDYYD